MATRNKPSKTLLATTHEASEPDYQRLAQACIRACILREKDIFYKLPYFAKVDDDFPKGIIVAKDGLCDVYKAKVVKMCDWLHSKGFLPEGHKNIMLTMRDLAYREAAINSMLNPKIPIDNSLEICDNVGSEVTDNKEGE